MNFNKLINLYDYQLPAQLIAQNPVYPRDMAKLMVYQKSSNKTFFSNFKHIGKYLPKNCVLVFNQTKVFPARLEAFKATGGKLEIFFIAQENRLIKVITNRKLQTNSKIYLKKNKKIFFEVISQKEQFYYLKPSFPADLISKILLSLGKTPLPPYIKNTVLTESKLRKEYQTVFAKTGLSVAAPTASLHFTKKLLQDLKKSGISFKFINLNVNLGTFAPLKPEQVKSGKLHEEVFEIDSKTAKSLNNHKKNGKKIIAVGTTVVRALESSSYGKIIKPAKKTTNIFIKPGYKFKFVDGLITNFHVPKSSLLMLVSAFVGKNKLMPLYKKAIKSKFRFFSFGDGMLIY